MNQPWSEIADVTLTGAMLFAVLLAGLRIVGNRALATMNASDFIVTVAVGTTFASTMLSADISQTRGASGIAALLGLQALTVWLSVKVPSLRKAAKGAPIVVFSQGQPRQAALERALVSDAELRQAVREHGYGGFEQIDVVILEPDGEFSVVPASQSGSRDAIPAASEQAERDDRHQRRQQGTGQQVDG
jgi:uncharacterized membrane protein YcaP (DUF421 family)